MRFSAPIVEDTTDTEQDGFDSLFSSTDKGQAKNFKVVVRVRPLNESEVAAGLGTCVQINSTTNVTIDDDYMADDDGGTNDRPKSRRRTSSLSGRGGIGSEDVRMRSFTYDRVFGDDDSQELLYNTAVRAVVLSTLEGYNGSIIAYGQTGTGKTHTIEGGAGTDDRGVIARAADDIFQHIHDNTSSSAQFLVRVSFLQIYNEKIHDLLQLANSASATSSGASNWNKLTHALGVDAGDDLSVREDPSGGVYVHGLREQVVTSPDEVVEWLRVGSQMRNTAATNMNRASSRSHAVFCITIESSTEEAEGGRTVTVGKLNLVDLAGSERIKSTGITLSDGKRMDEAKKINSSLSAFGKVILALTTGGTQHVPYRDSKLTRILQGSLGGNCKTTMITTVGPASPNASETVSSLKFATRAKKVKNYAVVNKDMTDKAVLAEYEREISRLRRQLQRQTSVSELDPGGERPMSPDEENRMHALTLKATELERARKQDQAAIEIHRAQIETERQEKEDLVRKIAALERQILHGAPPADATSDTSTPCTTTTEHGPNDGGSPPAAADDVDESSAVFQRALAVAEQRMKQHYEALYHTQLRDLERERAELAAERRQLQIERQRLPAPPSPGAAAEAPRRSPVAWGTVADKGGARTALVVADADDSTVVESIGDDPYRVAQSRGLGSSVPRGTRGSDPENLTEAPTGAGSLFTRRRLHSATVTDEDVETGDGAVETGDETEGTGRYDMHSQSLARAEHVSPQHRLQAQPHARPYRSPQQPTQSSAQSSRPHNTPPPPASPRGTAPAQTPNAHRPQQTSFDIYVQALQHPETGIPLSDARVNHQYVRDVFTGEQAAVWFQHNMEGVDSVTVAEAIGQKFVTWGTIVAVDGDATFTASPDVLYQFARHNSAGRLRAKTPVVHVTARNSVSAYSNRTPHRPTTTSSTNSSGSAGSADGSGSGSGVLDGGRSTSTGLASPPPPRPQTSDSRPRSARRLRRGINAVMNAFTSPPAHTGDGSDSGSAHVGDGGSAGPAHPLPAPPTSAPPPAMGRRGSTASLRRPTTAVALTDAFSDCGATLLHSAAGQGDRTAMKTFFQTFDVDVIDNQGRTPAMYACTTNKVKSVELLVKQGCDLHTQDHDGRTALLWASYYGHYDVTRFLLRTDPTLASHVGPDGRTAVHWAVKHPAPRCLDALLRASPPELLSLQDCEKQTALHWAVLCHNSEHIVRLLKAGCDPHITDELGRTALHYAVVNNSQTCMRALLDAAGPSLINIADGKGRTALHLAIAKRKSIDAVLLLLSYGAVDVDASDFRQTTPLHWAAVCGRSDICKVLVARGAHLDYRDASGMTPLHHADDKGYLETATVLQHLRASAAARAR
eukprot:m.1233155 g.1233155  ORF g.1233155 m.1233155 type:complete len:1363 (-) comp24662_c0_seq3:2940-7028(-)